MNPSNNSTFYIITVHFKNKKWIEIQNQYIQRYTTHPYKVIAIVSKDLEAFTPRHWITIRDSGITSHAAKLNIAGDFASQMTNENDIIVFLDSDCFPIASWCNQIIELLSKKKIVAVQRLENLGDLQPHPCFTCMESKSWVEIKGDWEKGFKWKNIAGDLVSDVGGNMLEILESKKIDWHPIHRTNTFNPHPVFFGIYGDIIYHHGAGSRNKWSRADHNNEKQNNMARYIYLTSTILLNLGSKIKKLERILFKCISKTSPSKTAHTNKLLSNHYVDRIYANEDIIAIFKPQKTLNTGGKDAGKP